MGRVQSTDYTQKNGLKIIYKPTGANNPLLNLKQMIDTYTEIKNLKKKLNHVYAIEAQQMKVDNLANSIRSAKLNGLTIADCEHQHEIAMMVLVRITESYRAL